MELGKRGGDDARGCGERGEARGGIARKIARGAGAALGLCPGVGGGLLWSVGWGTQRGQSVRVWLVLSLVVSCFGVMS